MKITKIYLCGERNIENKSVKLLINIRGIAKVVQGMRVHKVIGAYPKKDFTLIVWFDNNDAIIVDMKEYLKTKYFQALNNMEYFRTAMPKDYSVVWANGEEIDPWELEKGISIKGRS